MATAIRDEPIKDFYRELMERGNAMVSVTSGDVPTYGYAVRLPDCQRTYPAHWAHSPKNARFVALYIYDHLEALTTSGNYLVGRVDPTSGLVLLDVSMVVESESLATSLGYAHGARTVQDIASDTAIILDRVPAMV